MKWINNFVPLRAPVELYQDTEIDEYVSANCTKPRRQLLALKKRAA